MLVGDAATATSVVFAGLAQLTERGSRRRRSSIDPERDLAIGPWQSGLTVWPSVRVSAEGGRSKQRGIITGRIGCQQTLVLSTPHWRRRFRLFDKRPVDCHCLQWQGVGWG